MKDPAKSKKRTTKKVGIKTPFTGISSGSKNKTLTAAGKAAYNKAAGRTAPKKTRRQKRKGK